MLTPTQEKIHQVAMRHFLRDGFQKASLRRIVAESGFTSGAFYGYYDKKEALFDALVRDTAEGIVLRITQIGDRVEALPPEQVFSGMSRLFASALPELLDFLLARTDETRLLFKCAGGTGYENFLSRVMDREMAFWEKIAGPKQPISPLATRLLMNSYFQLLSDAVLTGQPREDIAEAMQDINRIYVCGMMSLIKEQKSREML